MHPALPFRHFLLALAVVSVWGTNFVVIKFALAHLPPLLFAALRFTLALIPALFFLPRPAVRWRTPSSPRTAATPSSACGDRRRHHRV